MKDMSAILEIPEVRQRLSPLSVEEYHRLGEFNENGHSGVDPRVLSRDEAGGK